MTVLHANMRPAPTVVWGAFLAAGALTGLSSMHGAMWPLAWVGMALLAFALATVRSRAQAALGVTLASLSLRAIWLHWAFAMTDVMVGEDQVGIALGFIAVTALPQWIFVLVGAVALHGRPWVRWWLPTAWVVAERVQVHWTSVANDWLHTQVDVAPVMNTLGHFGIWATTLVCLFIAASTGEALALRRRRVVWPALALALTMLVLPRPERADSQRIAKVGAVHATTLDTMPAVEGIAGLEWVVWPEVAFSARPHVSETRVDGAALDAPLSGVGDGVPEHLVGMTIALLSKKQNAVLAVGADGAIRGVRSKRVLFPVFEREFLGVGADAFLPGRAPPLLEVAGRKVVPLVCGELFTRELVAEGKAAGGQVLAILASDRYHAGLELVHRQVLAHVRLRAVEYDMPAVYASRHGRASFVAADGVILGTSAHDAPSGVLVFDGERVRDVVQEVTASVAVIYSRGSLHLRPDCPPGRCEYHALEDFTCPEDGRAARAVIVAGHAAPPQYLGADPATIAAAAACFAPELVVIDTCYGASTPLLSALAARGDFLVVASPRLVPGRGFSYGARFFEVAAADVRAAAVTSATPLFIGWPDADAMARAEAEVLASDGATLRPRVRSWNPTLVAVETAEGEVVAPADWKVIGQPPGRAGPRSRGPR